MKFTVPAVTTSAAILSMLFATCVLAQSDDSTSGAEEQSKAEVAVEAYDKADAGPKENWFGCPPVKGDESTAKAEEDCQPSDRAPQAASSESEQTKTSD